MTENTQACVRGCSIYQRHLDECADELCRGCLPRRAEHGHLCWPCHRRFELMLHDAPTVWRWLTGNMSAGEGAARAKEDFERSGSADGSPTPVKLAVLDLRDLLADRLTLWADDWAEHHKVTAPRHTVAAAAEVLLRWLPGLERLDWIGDWWEELAETMSDAHALAPWRPVMRRVPGVACPECREVNLGIFGGESDVTCLSCRTIIPEAWFGLWERIVRDEQEVAG
jgi:hypothetical protein